MTTDQAAKTILQSNGKIFTVTFIKRTTNEVRVMNCRLGVVKHLKGGELAYDPASHKLINVYDMLKKQYRSIAIEGIQQLTINGETHTILPNG